jgi:hypothetical protein
MLLAHVPVQDQSRTYCLGRGVVKQAHRGYFCYQETFLSTSVKEATASHRTVTKTPDLVAPSRSNAGRPDVGEREEAAKVGPIVASVGSV